MTLVSYLFLFKNTFRGYVVFLRLGRDKIAVAPLS